MYGFPMANLVHFEENGKLSPFPTDEQMFVVVTASDDGIYSLFDGVMGWKI